MSKEIKRKWWWWWGVSDCTDPSAGITVPKNREKKTEKNYIYMHFIYIRTFYYI